MWADPRLRGGDGMLYLAKMQARARIPPAAPVGGSVSVGAN